MAGAVWGRVVAGVGLAGLVGIVWSVSGGRAGEEALAPAGTTAQIAPWTTPTSEATVVEVDLPRLGAAQPLEDLDGWLQSEVSAIEDLRGRVVVVQFWTFGCINCKNTLANLQHLAAAHAGDDFEIVGVHSPEFDYEKDPAAIAAAAADLGVTWPIALDTGKSNFFTWQGSPAYWPRTYVIDREGEIRFDHIGEGAYDELNAAVDLLLSSS
jgi:thiol-disulfide isomerase/thioredoxin